MDKIEEVSVETLRKNLKDIRVVYVADGKNVNKNKSFFEDLFRQCYTIRSQKDNKIMEDVDFVPDLIIMSSKVKNVDAEIVIKTYLNNKIIPEVMLLADEGTEVKDLLRLYGLGITNFIDGEFEIAEFLEATKKIVTNLEYKREKVKEKDLNSLNVVQIKPPYEMNIAILEKSISANNVIKKSLLKNDASVDNIHMFKSIEDLFAYMKIQPKQQQIDIMIVGEFDYTDDMERIIKNVLYLKEDVYILTMSSQNTKENVTRIMSLGIKDVLLKPLEEGNVDSKIDKALKLGDGKVSGINSFLYNMNELISEYRYYRFLRKITDQEALLLEDYITFLRRKKEI